MLILGSLTHTHTQRVPAVPVKRAGKKKPKPITGERIPVPSGKPSRPVRLIGSAMDGTWLLVKATTMREHTWSREGSKYSKDKSSVSVVGFRFVSYTKDGCCEWTNRGIHEETSRPRPGSKPTRESSWAYAECGGGSVGFSTNLCLFPYIPSTPYVGEG